MEIPVDGSMDFQKIVAAARIQKFKVTKTEAGHWKFVPPQMNLPIVVTSGTPGDHRAIHNFLARLRRSGFRDGQRAVRVG